MTDETLSTDGPVRRPTGGGLAGAIAPEGVAAILAIVVVVALLGSRLAGAGGGVALATPSPSPTPVATATPARGVDIAAINALLSVDQGLLAQAAVIAKQLDAKPIDPSALRTAMSPIAFELRQRGLDAANALARSPGGNDLGSQMGTFYSGVQDDIIRANNLALANVKGWTTSAQALTKKILDTVPALDTRLIALRASGGLPSPSAGASPSVAPSTSAGASASIAPSPSVAPSPTSAPVSPPPATPVPTATVAPSSSVGPTPSLGPNLLANGSFEAGVADPWMVIISDPTALATVTPDGVSPHSPKVAARIDIQSQSTLQFGIAYQQSGFQIAAGGYYQISIALRSTSMRDVRVRISDDSSGQTLDTHVFTIGSQWTVETYPVTSLIGSSSAVFSVDVGRSALTVWVDDVSLSRVPPG